MPCVKIQCYVRRVMPVLPSRQAQPLSSAFSSKTGPFDSSSARDVRCRPSILIEKKTTTWMSNGMSRRIGTERHHNPQSMRQNLVIAKKPIQRPFHILTDVRGQYHFATSKDHCLQCLRSLCQCCLIPSLAARCSSSLFWWLQVY